MGWADAALPLRLSALPAGAGGLGGGGADRGEPAGRSVEDHPGDQQPAAAHRPPNEAPGSGRDRTCV